MKTILLVVLIGFIGPVAAQQTTSHTGRNSVNRDPAVAASREADSAARKLNLSADQKAAWQAAARDRITANAPLREQMRSASTPDEKKNIRTQMHANTERFRNTVEPMLNDQQKKAWHESQMERRGKRRKTNQQQ